MPIQFPGIPDQSNTYAPFLALTQGIKAGSGLMSNVYENAQRRMQNQQEKKKQAAQQAYGAAGGGGAGIEAASKIDPATGMAFQKEQLNIYKDALGFIDSNMDKAYNNLSYYNGVLRPTAIKLGLPPGTMPKYDNEDDLNKGMFGFKRELAKIKLETTAPKIQGGYLMQPGQAPVAMPPTPYQQGMLNARGVQLGQGQERVNQGAERNDIARQRLTDKEGAPGKAAKKLTPQQQISSLESDAAAALEVVDGAQEAYKKRDGNLNGYYAKRKEILADLNKKKSRFKEVGVGETTKKAGGSSKANAIDEETKKALVGGEE